MHTSSSRCQTLEESLRSMETPNTLSERWSIRRLSQRKYKADSQGNSPVRPLNLRTPSSAPGVTYNKTVGHVPNKRSNAAPTAALANLRYQCGTYITMLWKYHGQKGRGTITARLKHGLNRTRGCRLFHFLLLSGLHSSEGLSGVQLPHKQYNNQGSRKLRRTTEL